MALDGSIGRRDDSPQYFMILTNGGIANEQLPFQGTVLCCTSLPQDARLKLADIATQMGAVHKLDLTSDVTHLIVGSVGTPKYVYVAKERPDISVLHYNWIEAARQAWIGGGDVDVADLEQKYRLPTFFGLKICLTGFEDMEQRKAIEEAVIREGGQYHGDLTKQVTHLVAAAPQGAKYTHAKQWHVKIVGLRWLEESLRRKMVLDETLYDPMLPTEEQGKGAFRSFPKTRVSLGKRSREDESQASVDDPGKRKLRRTASTRLQSQSQDMWQDLSARQDESQTIQADQWNDNSNVETQSRRSSVVETFRPPSRLSNGFQPQVQDAAAEPHGLFAGVYILMVGFEPDRAAKLHHFLEANGAIVVPSTLQLDDASTNVNFRSRQLLVPHDLAQNMLPLPEVAPGTEVVTEWWIERCVHYKRTFTTSEDTLSMPLWNLDVKGFSGLTVSTTGFPSLEYRQVAKAVTLLGGVYQEVLATTASVLISGAEVVRGEKAFYATRHAIKVVNADWFWKCLRVGSVVPFDDYLVKLPAADPSKVSPLDSTNRSTTGDIEEKRSCGATKLKEETSQKRLSSTRRRHATPSLPMQRITSPPKPQSQNEGPFVHEDEEESGGFQALAEDVRRPAETSRSPRRSRPLQEMSPNASPRKDVRPELDTRLEDNPAPKIPVADGEILPIPTVATLLSPKPSSPSPVPTRAASESPGKKSRNLTATLAGLIQQQHASSRPTTAEPAVPPRRKSRPLGRSASGIGNRSLSASNNSDHGNSQSRGSEAQDSDSIPRAEISAPPPCTQLGYETAEAEAHRVAMGKRMGIEFGDEGEGGGRRERGLAGVKESGLGAVGGIGERRAGRRNAR